MLFIPLHLAVLALLMYLYAKHEADISVAKICMVFVPTIWILNVASNFVGPLILVLYFILPFLFLKQWFYVGAGKAAAIAGTFTAYMVAFSIAFYFIMIKPSSPSEDDQTADVEAIDHDLSIGRTEILPGMPITKKGHYHLGQSLILIVSRQDKDTLKFIIKTEARGPRRHHGKFEYYSSWMIVPESPTSCWIYYGAARSRLYGVEHLTIGEDSTQVIRSAKDPNIHNSEPDVIKERIAADKKRLREQKQLMKDIKAKQRR